MCTRSVSVKLAASTGRPLSRVHRLAQLIVSLVLASPDHNTDLVRAIISDMAQQGARSPPQAAPVKGGTQLD